MNKLVIICFLFPAFVITSFAQDILIERKININSNEEGSSVIKLNKPEKTPLTKNDDVNDYAKIETSLMDYTRQLLKTKTAPEKPSFNIVSSFRNNIKFGGLWNGYAIVNFTPNMFIRPFKFISFYAGHNISMYIPMKGIKENMKSLIIEGAAVLAVDNSVKFLFSSNHFIQSIAGFVFKNLVIGLMKDAFNNNSNGRLEFRYYYYAISISF